MHILNASNGVVANYEYDAWGNVVSVTGVNGNAVAGFALINPIRSEQVMISNEETTGETGLPPKHTPGREHRKIHRR